MLEQDIISRFKYWLVEGCPWDIAWTIAENEAITMAIDRVNSIGDMSNFASTVHTVDNTGLPLF